MGDNLLMGLGRYMVPIPRMIWQRQMRSNARKIDAGLGFMSGDHHDVRNFVVRELPRVGKPLSPEFIAQNLNLPVEQVNAILDELEKHLTFLFRNEQGAVAWAYPVTVDKTPHHATFSTGEQAYSA